MRAPITVVGSLNMDFVAQVATLPVPGQTVLGSGFRTIPGGKGANQACAAGKLGGLVRMVGRVGDDVYGRQLRDELEAVGVDVGGVQVTAQAASGVALIVVEARGQNLIVVAPGANATLAVSDVEAALTDMNGGYLLLQLETPLDTVEAAAASARRHGATVLLDPAPAQPLSAALLAKVDILTPNESEANVLLGRGAVTVSLEDAPAMAQALLRLGSGTVVLKLGENGAMVADREGLQHVPTPRVTAVDATAAGDTFNGALAVALSEGRTLREAVVFANAAAALSVTRLGAQSSIPRRAEVDAQLPRH
jgi:ribokinase